jgi:phenylacetate-coenzyme A ligase PaaK-like adenylate-forming protein
LSDFRLISDVFFYRRAQGKETADGSLIEELKRREAATWRRQDRLRDRIEELSGDLARAEERVSRLAITSGSTSLSTALGA